MTETTNMTKRLVTCCRMCKVLDLGIITSDANRISIVKGERSHYSFATIDELEYFLEQTFEKKTKIRKKQMTHTNRMITHF